MAASRASSASTVAVFGAKNLGRAVSLYFARRGWTVVVGSRTAADVERVAREVNEAGGRGVPMVCDISAADTLHKFNEHNPDLVVLAQSSGWRPPKSILEMDDETFSRAFGAGVFGFRNVIQVLGRHMAERGSGTVVQIGTTSALRAKEGFAHLAAAQFALRGLVQAAAKDLRPKGVHVAFLPVDGVIDGENTAPFVEQLGREKSLPQDEIAKAILYLYEQQPRAWTHELVLRPWQSEWSAPY